METRPIDYWRSVPPEYDAAWLAVFQASREGLDLSAPCPVCGVAALHRWYGVGGGLWEWCSACHSFEHYSARVPEWWACGLKVNFFRLQHDPGAIEAARLEQELLANQPEP